MRYLLSHTDQESSTAASKVSSASGIREKDVEAGAEVGRRRLQGENLLKTNILIGLVCFILIFTGKFSFPRTADKV